MTSLTEFIEARLTSDENHARKDLHMVDRASNGGAWGYGLGYNLPYSELGEGGSIGRLTATYGRQLADGEPDQHNADAMLVARMVRSARGRAERMLREVEAKRRLLALHGQSDPDGHDSSGYRFSCSHCDQTAPCASLRLLALPFADHPDYLPEWSPETVVPTT